MAEILDAVRSMDPEVLKQLVKGTLGFQLMVLLWIMAWKDSWPIRIGRRRKD